MILKHAQGASKVHLKHRLEISYVSDIFPNKTADPILVERSEA